MHQPIFVYSDHYRAAAFGNNHPLAIARVELVYDLCADLGWFNSEQFVESPIATREQLITFHDPDYVDALATADQTGAVSKEVRERFKFGTMENPYFPGVFARASRTVGGSILAAQRVLEGGLAYHPSGGTHHGLRDRASGFCYFNDPVFAIQTFLTLGKQRVAYVDLDAHHGDGVELAFANDARVSTTSVHEANRWPYTGQASSGTRGRCLNVPVPKALNDTEFALVMEETVLPFARRAEPEAIVITCGADALSGDPLSGLELSNTALWTAVEQVAACAPSVVVVGGGGYNPWTLARCWTGLWGRLAGHAIPPSLPSASVARLEKLECDLVDEDDVLPHWQTTLADPPNHGPIRAEVRELISRCQQEI